MNTLARWTFLWDGYLCQMDTPIRWTPLQGGHPCEMDTSVRWTPLLDEHPCKVDTLVRWIPLSDGHPCKEENSLRWTRLDLAKFHLLFYGNLSKADSGHFYLTFLVESGHQNCEFVQNLTLKTTNWISYSITGTIYWQNVFVNGTKHFKHFDLEVPVRNRTPGSGSGAHTVDSR